jgi:SNF2 family DNA or RNA helicase
MGKEFTLWAHQRTGIARSLESDTFAFFFDAGTGKSCTTIRSICERMNIERRYFKTLIFAPPVVLTNWKCEFKTFSDIDQAKIEVLYGPGKERALTLAKKSPLIAITNYESLLMKDVFEAIKKWAPECIVFDESHRIKNPQASRTKKAIELADTARFKYLLTGTPVLNTPMDLFAQFRAMDGGATFGKNFFTFRAKYFYDKNAHMPRHIHFPNWVLRPESLDIFNLIIHRKGMVAKKAECLDLPPLIKKTIEVELSPEQRRAYEAMKKEFIAFFENGAAVAQLAITKALRLQQILSGFARIDTGSEQIDQPFKDNPRATALEEILEDLLENPESKVIVWAVFKQNYKDIAEVCKRLKVKFVELHGEVSGKKRDEAVDSFNKNPETRVLIGHPGSAGIGVNLIAASTSIFYSRGFSLEFDIQAEARNYRGGSERHASITRIDLVAPNTLDAQILERLSQKQQITDHVLKDIVRELKNE